MSTSDAGSATLSDEPPVLNAERSAVEEDAPIGVETLAERAERDVEDFLELRREAARRQARTQDPADEPQSADGSEESAPERIVWNEPPTPPQGTPADSDRPKVEKPPVRQSPLFRDPAEALEIDRPAGEQDVGDQEAEADSAEPAKAIAGDPLDVLLVKVRRHLNRRAAYSDQPLRELLGMAAMVMVDPELRLNPEAFPDLSETERRLLGRLQGFFADLGETLDGSIEAEEAIINAVLSLQESLVEEPQLQLPAAALCWRVGGFGDYQPFERNTFLAHGEQQVILYLEIDGFASEMNKMNQWLTEISQQLEIINDSDGIPVWSEPWQKAVDVTSHRRRDFFTTQIITLPKALSVGKYHFKIRVRDNKSGAEAEESITFEMVADPKLAVKVPH
ncbi:MAG: hypothetical protein SYC29_02510 [Planctomycetota bacterium]|nr:hypothetical protein [Planctomycetota bacterium]